MMSPAVGSIGQLTATTTTGTTTTTTTTSSSAPASTPTGTRTTRASSPPDRRHRRPFPSLESPMEEEMDLAAVTGNTTVSSGGRRPVYSEDGELSEGVALYFEHWASPTELLQLRTLCGDVVNKYKNECTRLLGELEEVKKGRDALQHEVQESRKLRQLYLKADAEYQKTCKERAEWSEERELLRLRLQRLSVDKQRLLQILTSRKRGTDPRELREWMTTSPSTLTGGTGPTTLTSSTTQTGFRSTIPTPSPTSSSTTGHTREGRVPHFREPQQPQQSQQSQRQHQQQHHPTDYDTGSGVNNSSSVGDDYFFNRSNSNNNNFTGDINGVRREQLRLIEELQRCTTEYAELESRFHFARTLWDMTATRGEQRVMLLASENEKLKGQLRHWRSVAEDNASRLDATKEQLQDRCSDLEEARRALQVSHEERQTAVVAGGRAAEESIASIKAAHAEELARLQQQLQSALDDSSRTREKLQGALEVAQRGADAQREKLMADIDLAEQKYSDALRAKDEAEAALTEAVSLHAQKQAQLEHELHNLRSTQTLALKKSEEDSVTLNALREENAKLTARIHEMEEELQTANGQLGAAMEKLQQMGDLEEALVSTRARAEDAELEVQTQQSYYADQLRLHQTALAELQKQRDDEVERLGRSVQRLRLRYESNKLRLAAAIKGMGQAAEKTAAGTTCNQQEPPQGPLSLARDGPLPGEALALDAVTLLQQSAAIVATLARTIHRETHTS